MTIPSASDPRHHAPCLSLAAGTCCSTSRDATSDNSMAVQCAAATRTPSPPCHAPVAISFKGTPSPPVPETAATCADDRWHRCKACAVLMAGVTGMSAAAALVRSMAVQCAAATRTPSPACHAPVATSFKDTHFLLVQETAATCADNRWHPCKACAVHMVGVIGTSAAAALHARALPVSLRTPPRVSCSMRTCRATMRMTCCAIFRCSHSAVARAHTHTHCSHSAVALALRLFGVKSALC